MNDAPKLTPGEENEASISRWLLDHGGAPISDDALFEGLCIRLATAGLQIMRANLSLGDSHPQLFSRTLMWRPGQSLVVTDHPYEVRLLRGYRDSPVSIIHQGAQAIRRRLEGPNPRLDFPILEELKSEGATEYVAMALAFTNGSRHFVSFTTGARGGFAVESLAMLDRLMPLIALRIELVHARRATSTLLRTYLGSTAAERVEAGTIRRSQGEKMRAILVFADLRAYTHMTDTLSASELIEVLGRYYEAVAEPLEARGADINKLIGDAMLALFPLRPNEDPLYTNATACTAVQGVHEALDRLRAIPQEALPPGVRTLSAGFGLHVGEVTFGNVGSKSRLDFTMIGPAVNEVSRVQDLTRQLARPLIASKAFANLPCTLDLESLGFQVLRGFREPREVFAVKGL
ncbi:MAG: adenylate/guanylate cyclase domain-containing protein [Alphaproteobacteria bacterium]